MEDDIQNYLPTVMFRGTPCIYRVPRKHYSSKTSSQIFKIMFGNLFVNLILEAAPHYLLLSRIVSDVIWVFWLSVSMKTTFLVHWSTSRVTNLTVQPWWHVWRVFISLQELYFSKNKINMNNKGKWNCLNIVF